MSRQTYTIILVEDNIGDIRLTHYAIKDLKTTLHLDAEIELLIFQDGESVVEYLQQDMSNEQNLPDLVLLDLNIPFLSGQEVLRRLKTHEQLKTVPVVILTTSQASHEALICNQYHANAYVIKPMNYEVFADRIAKTISFWLLTNNTYSRMLSDEQNRFKINEN